MGHSLNSLNSRVIKKPSSKFSWTRPNPGDFVQFSVRKMDWLKDYSIEKVVETVVRWQVRSEQTNFQKH